MSPMGPCSSTVKIVNARGLHARAARKFVELAGRFSARVTVTHDGECVDADSIMEILMLAAPMGSTLTIQTDGDDAQDALDALCRLVNNGFDEV